MSLRLQHDPHNSDSDDDDEDYVPPDENKNDSDSEPSDDEGGAKGVGEMEVPPTVVDEEKKKRARDALWAEFQASAAAGPSKSPPSRQPRTVKIERRYKFAGEPVIMVVEVPEDHPEAKKWPLWKDPSLRLEETTDVSTTAAISPLIEPAQTIPTPVGVDTTAVDSSSLNPIIGAPITSTPQASGPSYAPKPPIKRPGPRKPKTALAPLPGPTKAKKLTTLDKSAMDWQRHIQTEQQAGSSIKDELDANRRAGGYLEKVEFLKRVEERKEENLDAMKSSKRRKL